MLVNVLMQTPDVKKEHHPFLLGLTPHGDVCVCSAGMLMSTSVSRSNFTGRHWTEDNVLSRVVLTTGFLMGFKDN